MTALARLAMLVNSRERDEYIIGYSHAYLGREQSGHSEGYMEGYHDGGEDRYADGCDVSRGRRVRG